MVAPGGRQATADRGSERRTSSTDCGSEPELERRSADKGSARPIRAAPTLRRLQNSTKALKPGEISVAQKLMSTNPVSEAAPLLPTTQGPGARHVRTSHTPPTDSD